MWHLKLVFIFHQLFIFCSLKRTHCLSRSCSVRYFMKESWSIQTETCRNDFLVLFFFSILLLSLSWLYLFIFFNSSSFTSLSFVDHHIYFFVILCTLKKGSMYIRRLYWYSGNYRQGEIWRNSALFFLMLFWRSVRSFFYYFIRNWFNQIFVGGILIFKC